MRVPKSTKTITGNYGVSFETQKIIIVKIESHLQGICLDASSGSFRAFSDADTNNLLDYYQHFYGDLGKLIDFVVKTKDEYDELFAICGKTEVYRFFDPPRVIREDKYGKQVRSSTSLHFIVLVPFQPLDRSISIDQDIKGGKTYEKQLSLFDSE